MISGSSETKTVADQRDRGRTPDSKTRDPCDGCHECGLRCTAGVQMTRSEFDRIVEYLQTQDSRQIARVLDQEKHIVWFEDTMTEACVLYDVTRHQCVIYPVRPLICRLFGHVEWLPCPLGKPVPCIREGLRVVQDYAQERRATFQEWCSALGFFDLARLTSGPG